MEIQNKHIYISVYLHKRKFVPAGVVTFNEQTDYACFTYFRSYIEQDLPPLNPSTLNWRDGNKRHFFVNTKQNPQMLDRTFWELLPNKNDWGHQVLVQKFPEYEILNNAEKLYFLGSRTVGGLRAHVKEKTFEENITNIDWLDKVRDESIKFYNKIIKQISSVKSVTPLSSYGGARPKCTFQDENGDFWIAKFNLPSDPYNMARVEQIAMDMSRDLGLPTAESKVLTLPSGEDVFLSKRFDRKNNERFHSLSLFALAPGNEMKKNPSIPGKPGGFIQTLIRRYSDFEDMDSLNVVLKMLLDIGVNNTDNHLRNMRIILNRNYKWQLAPMYDIIFNPYNQNHIYNPAGLPTNELYLRNQRLISAMSKELGVKEEIIEQKASDTIKIVENWESYCDKYNLSTEDKDKIASAVMLGLYRQELKKRRTFENKSENKSNKSKSHQKKQN